MPLTPFHIGPALTLGYFLRKKLHLPTLIVASVIMDIEPLVVLVFSIPGYPLHGYLHTFLFAVLLGSALGLLFYFADGFLRKSFERLALTEGRGYGAWGYVAAGFLGWSIHILLDASLYGEIKPLFPLTVNPFYNPNLDLIIGHLCVLLLFSGSFLYLRNLYRNLSSRADNRVAGVCTGLVATVLGFIALITMIFNQAYVFPSIGLIFWGLLLFYASLKRLEPLMMRRIVASGVMMLIAASLFSVLMLRVFFSRLIYKQFLSELTFFSSASTILFFSSWFTSLIGIILLRPVLHRFGEDRSFKLLVDLLIIGWALVSVFIGVLIVVPILIIILLKMPILLTFSSPKQKSL
ncbi:MAG: hypothetical protein QXI87_04615 [Thermoproteota archaeon]